MSLLNNFGAEAIWVLCLLALAAFFMAVMETLESAAKFDASILRRWRRDYWLKTESWVRKYKRDAFGSPVVLGYDKRDAIRLKPRFFGSTTFFVALTDGWHKAKLAKWVCISAAILVAAGADFSGWRAWVLLVLVKSFVSGLFELFYSRILKR